VRLGASPEHRPAPRAQEHERKREERREEQDRTLQKREQEQAEPERSEVTFMMRNIPGKYTPAQLLEQLRDWRPFVDFFYLPTDFKHKYNLGYAFLNFHDVEAAKRFQLELHGSRLPLHQDSGKILQVQEARVQGLDQYVERFRNSAVMADSVLPGAAKPMLFEKHTGQQIPFPKPEGDLPRVAPRFKRR